MARSAAGNIKNQLLGRARGILHRTPPGSCLAGEDLQFMLDLLRRHPRATEKAGAGIQAIQVREGLSASTKTFYVIRSDGSVTDFSYLKCINSPPTHRTEVLRAARNAVRPQTKEYKNALFAKGPVRCAITRALLSCPEHCHVDHEVRFEILFDEFCHDGGVRIEEIQVQGHGDEERTLYFTDESLAARWAEYHRLHAVLRPLAPNVNLSRTRK